LTLPLAQDIIMLDKGAKQRFPGRQTGAMANINPAGKDGTSKGVTVNFGSRFAESKLFSQVFSHGMGLVEETADYLDGQGRTDARGLNRHAAIAYASESMRLTTRLMQLASWLLLRRAVIDGEMTIDEADREKHRVNLEGVKPEISEKALKALPPDLANLITRSIRLHDRISKLDAMFNEDERQIPGSEASPIEGHLDRLKAAFGSSE
jgi:regulator of CtrA degradation